VGSRLLPSLSAEGAGSRELLGLQARAAAVAARSVARTRRGEMDRREIMRSELRRPCPARQRTHVCIVQHLLHAERQAGRAWAPCRSSDRRRTAPGHVGHVRGDTTACPPNVRRDSDGLLSLSRRIDGPSSTLLAPAPQATASRGCGKAPTYSAHAPRTLFPSPASERRRQLGEQDACNRASRIIRDSPAIAVQQGRNQSCAEPR